MRRILVEARRKKAEKHGGGCSATTPPNYPSPRPNRTEDLVALDEALDRLAAVDPPRPNW